jgi:AMP nucleosidase
MLNEMQQISIFLGVITVIFFVAAAVLHAYPFIHLIACIAYYAYCAFFGIKIFSEIKNWIFYKWVIWLLLLFIPLLEPFIEHKFTLAAIAVLLAAIFFFTNLLSRRIGMLSFAVPTLGCFCLFYTNITQNTPHQVITETEYALQTLERYSGSPRDLFQPLILLTNFPNYVDHFAAKDSLKVYEGSMFKVAHNPGKKITMCDFKIGSPAAALTVDVLSFVPVKAILMVGLCGGLDESYQIGDYFIPLGAVREDCTSINYLPIQVPALPDFSMTLCSYDYLKSQDIPFRMGNTFTTNIRMWEYNTNFKNNLKKSLADVIEMECATIFICSYFRNIPSGAFMMVSDMPLKEAKTNEAVKKLYKDKMPQHIEIAEQILLCYGRELGLD